MSQRFLGVARGVMLALVVAGVAAPSFGQQPAPPPIPRGGIRAPGNARPQPGNPPLPNAPTAAGQPGALAPPPNQPGRPGAAAGTEAANSASPPSRLEVVKGPAGQLMVTMEFYGIAIDHLLRILAYSAGVTIIKTQAVTGSVTVIAKDPVPLDVAFQMLNSILSVQKWMLVRDGPNIYKVVPTADAVQQGRSVVRTGSDPANVPETSDLITQLIPLTNLSAADVSQLIVAAGLLTPERSIIPTSTNALIITDTSANLRRVLELVSTLESELAGGYKVFHLRYMHAEDMANLISNFVLSRGSGGGGGTTSRQPWEQLVVGRGTAAQPGQARTAAASRTGGAQAGASGGTATEFAYPDTRTNSLIVQATPLHVAQIKDLIDQFDVEVSYADSYFVYNAQNLSATQLGNLLKASIAGATVNVIQDQVTGTTGSATGGGTATGRTSRGSSSLSSRSSLSSGGGYSAFSSGGVEVQPQAAAPSPSASGSSVELEPLAAPSPGATSEPIMVAQAEGGQTVPSFPMGGFPTFPMMGQTGTASASSLDNSQTASITVDGGSNTMVISAPPEQMEVIKALLKKLDVMPPQVYIQAVIVEVSLTSDNSLGFQWSGLTGSYRRNSDQQFTGGFTVNGSSSFDTGGLYGTITGPGDFQGVLSAITSDTHAKVLSTPSIFTANNQPGEINVSSSRPFPVSTITTTSGTPVTTTSVTYRDVGIVLSVTPRVTQGDLVQMDIDVQANEPGAAVDVAGSSYPSIQTRSASATLNVQAGYTVVMGGLMRDTVSRSGSGIPILSKLPLIGALFRTSSTTKEKTELLVFLTPHVIRTPSEAATLSQAVKETLPEKPESLERSFETPIGHDLKPVAEPAPAK